MGIKRVDLIKLAGECERLLSNDESLRSRFESSINHWLGIIKQFPDEQPAAGEVSNLTLFNQFKQADGALRQIKKNIATTIGPTAFLTDEQKFSALKSQISQDLSQAKPYLQNSEPNSHLQTLINQITHQEKQAYPNLLRMINQGLQNKTAPLSYADANNLLRSYQQQWQQLDKELRAQYVQIIEAQDTRQAQREALAATLNNAKSLINRAQMPGDDPKISEYKNHLQEKIIQAENDNVGNIQEVIQALNLDIAELNQLLISQEQARIQNKAEMNQNIIDLTFAFEGRSKELIQQRKEAGLDSDVVKDLAQAFREENSHYPLSADASHEEVISFTKQKLDNLRAISLQLEEHIQATQEELSRLAQDKITPLKDNIAQQFLKLETQLEPFRSNLSDVDYQQFLVIKSIHDEVMNLDNQKVNSVELSKQMQSQLLNTQEKFTMQISEFDAVLAEHRAAQALAENFTLAELSDYAQNHEDKSTLLNYVQDYGHINQIEAAYILKNANLLDTAKERLSDKAFCEAVIKLNHLDQATSTHLDALIASKRKVEFFLHGNHVQAQDINQSDTLLFEDDKQFKQWVISMFLHKDKKDTLIESLERIKTLAPKQYRQDLFMLAQQNENFAKLLEKSERIELVIPFLSTIVSASEEASSVKVIRGKNYTRDDLIALLNDRAEAQISLISKTLTFTDQKLEKIQKLSNTKNLEITEKSNTLNEFRHRSLEIFLEKDQPLEQEKLLSKAAHQIFPSNDWGKKIINSLIGFINKVVHLFSKEADEIKPLPSTTQKQYRHTLKEGRDQHNELDKKPLRNDDERIKEYDDDVASNPAPT
ncbi:MAG: hypothetical protein BGO90_12615 [Legionella sp. 40-6]|nr:MAG: hypothetical protein BGO90_12615 [Legionella sp. 40-6]